MSNWNDGGVPFGARKVQFYAPAGTDVNGSTTWSAGTVRGIGILEADTPDRPQYVQNRYDEVRQPNGGFGQDDVVEFSATYQLAVTTSTYIQCGDAFTTTLPSSSGGNTAESFVCISAGSPEAQGDIRKQSLRCRKLYKATSLPPAYP